VLDKLKSYITKHQLFDKSDQLALAISGGKDSVCAAHLLDALNIDFIMVHVNFNLRGEESVNDEQFVQNLAKNLTSCKGFLSKSANTEEFAASNKITIQEAAREIRYSYFRELYDKGAISKLITAHHKTDSLETFFINLYRKSGISGLTGISKKRDFIIRPMLCFSSGEIASYVDQERINYREDSSNSKTKYLRNKLRHLIVPNITEHLSDFESRSLESIEILNQENESLNFLLENYSKSIITFNSNDLSIQKSAVYSFPQPTVLLYYILDKFGLNPSQCEQIGSLSRDISGKIFQSKTHQVLVDRDSIVVSKIESIVLEPIEISEEGTYNFGSALFTLKKVSQANFSSDKYQECIQLPSNLFPLTLRNWSQGDRFQPLGMKGTKLISDFLIDEKISLTQKGKIPLVCSKDEVLWVAGYRISEKIKISDLTNIYHLSLIFE
jgi:tRNA(Ile)-lysidine synthase